MKRIATLFFLLTTPSTIYAQIDSLRLTPSDTTYWRKSFSAGANINQAAFSSNWRAGGVSSIALSLFLNARSNYAREKVSWDNQIDMQYGILRNAGQGMRKSVDRIFLDSKYGHQLSPHWNAFVSGNFISQFAQGFQYDVNGVGNNRLISNFLSPGFLTFGLGFEYKPQPWFSLRLSPFAPRFTFLADEAVGVNERYGVPLGRSTRTEWLAAQVQLELKKDIAQNMNLQVSYLTYANYETLALNTIDHRLNVMLTAKVNQRISVNLTGMLLYDRDQDTSVQYSQGLALGFLYSIQNFVDKPEPK
ncbi:DUF3078 domain-containing protein [Spirosoma pulveris]